MSDYYYEVMRADGKVVYGAVTTHTIATATMLIAQQAQRVRGTVLLGQVFKEHAVSTPSLKESISGVV